MSGLPRDERGLSLLEVTVVMVLGGMITAGLIGFYLSSQGLWLDGSTQAITQREASLVASAIRDSVRKSSRAEVAPSPDAQHQQLALFRHGEATPFYYFYWNPDDSLVHAGPNVGGAGSGPIGASRAARLQFIKTDEAVRTDMRLLTATGNRVDIGAFAVFKN